MFYIQLCYGGANQGHGGSLWEKRLTSHHEMSFKSNDWGIWHLARYRDPLDTRLPDRVQRDQYRWARQHSCEKVQSHPWGSSCRFLLQTPLCHWSNHQAISLSSDDSWRTCLCQENDIGVTYFLSHSVDFLFRTASQVHFWKSAKCESSQVLLVCLNCETDIQQ